VNSRVTIVESRFTQTLMITSSWYVPGRRARDLHKVATNGHLTMHPFEPGRIVRLPNPFDSSGIARGQAALPF
jgi:hypothetical protein